MDFAFTAEQEKFRRDLRSFFAEPRVQDAISAYTRFGPREIVDPRQVYRWLGERGWLAPHWPEEYGGLGKTSIEMAILYEELIRHGVPDLPFVVTVAYVGTFLLLAGSDELKRGFLPRMAAGTISVSILYSEPGVGSDLSALQATADLDGDAYVLRGRKIYSQTTQLADYSLVAARTAQGRSKTDGITLFLVPLHAPGVRVHALPNISDDTFADVELDGVRVPPSLIVGELHEGWALLNRALTMERTGFDFHLKVRSWLDLLIRHAQSSGRLSDPWVAQQLVALDAQVEAGRVLAWRMVAAQARGEVDAVEAAKSKWFNTELGRSIALLGIELDGPEGVLSRWDGHAPMGGLMEAAYREVPGLTLSAGTSEVMLYLIAVSGLQL